MRKESPRIKSWVIVVSVIVLFIIAGFTMDGRKNMPAPESFMGKVIRPFQTVLYKSTSAVSQKLRPVRDLFSLYKENKMLKEELLVTRKELIHQTMLREEFEDLKKLRKALNYSIRNSLSKSVTAEVIGRNPSNFYNMFVINVGQNKGIVKNSMVYNGSGLIGQVYESGDDWSKVLSISDSKGAVSFQILDSKRKFNGIVKGNGGENLEGYFYDEKAVAMIGDKIMTSGVGIYPRGVIIGTVVDVNNDDKTLLPTIKVKPYVNFNKVNRVMVIPPVKEFKEEKQNEK